MRLYVILALLLCVAHPAHALHESSTVRNDHSVATLVTESERVSAGEPFWLALRLQLQEHWHSYWKNAGDSGFGINIEVNAPEGTEIGAIHWQAPKRFELTGIVNYGYGGDAWYFIPVTLPESASGDVQITAKADWLVCDEEQCVPESANLSLVLQVSDIPANSDIEFQREFAKIPELRQEESFFLIRDSDVLMGLPKSVTTTEGLQFFPLDNNIVSNSVLPQFSEQDGRIIARFEKGILAGQGAETLQYVLVHEGMRAQQFTAMHDSSQMADAVQSITGENLGLPLALLFAFIGGLVLNLMPCVLPVLSLKLFSVMKHAGGSRRIAVAHGLAYTAGVLASFAVIGVLLIILQQAGQSLGWGFQLQSPVFVAALAWLMLMVGFNLSGLYELPVIGWGQGRAHSDAPYGSAATGVLAVLVATPCTAPFMAPALGFALTQPPLVLLLILLSLGFGLAAPFFLVSLMPSLAKRLPKAGGWMLRFKEFLAFPMYATAAWLLWVLARQSGTAALGWWLMLAIMSGFALWWIAPLGVSMRRKVIAWGLIIGTLGGSLWLIQQSKQAEAFAAITEPYSAARLEALRKDGAKVFVYGTADWCITCKVNEKLALNDASVIAHMQEQGITVLQADWTDYNEEITAFLRSHGRAGVPIYVYYTPDAPAQLLPQILTPALVKDILR